MIPSWIFRGVHVILTALLSYKLIWCALPLVEDESGKYPGILDFPWGQLVTVIWNFPCGIGSKKLLL